MVREPKSHSGYGNTVLSNVVIEGGGRVSERIVVRNEKLYHVFYGMKARCNNPNNPNYHKYGARGIKLCDEWEHNYMAFRQWALENGYKEGLTIDRVDSDKGYYPENCRWITLSENSARANLGRHKNKTKLENVFAISESGDRVDIPNILQFCRDHNLPYSNVVAALHGRIPPHQCGWTFHSNKARR